MSVVLMIRVGLQTICHLGEIMAFGWAYWLMLCSRKVKGKKEDDLTKYKNYNLKFY